MYKILKKKYRLPAIVKDRRMVDLCRCGADTNFVASESYRKGPYESPTSKPMNRRNPTEKFNAQLKRE